MKILMLGLLTITMVSCSASKDAVPQPAPVSASITAQKQLSSANNERINWLNSIPASAELTPFQVEVRSISGEQLTSLAQIHSNTDYFLVVRSDRPTRYAVKTISGFTLTAPSQSQNLSEVSTFTEFTIPIHTDVESTPSLFISLVPIHNQGRTLTKEKPKSFLLLSQ